MLRIYCDTNIYSLIKETHPSFNADLKNTLDDLKNILIFTFSFAHLEDKSRTKKEHIHLAEDDLARMGEYVKDNYFSYEESDKQTHFFLAEPNEAFNDINFDTYNEILKNGFDYRSLFNEFDNDEEMKPFSSMIDSLLNMPMLNPRNSMSDLNSKSEEWLDKIYPKEDYTTFGELMNKMMGFGNQFLNDNSEMKEIRKYLEGYINRDDYSFEKWGLEFDRKFSDTQIKMSFSESIEKAYEVNTSYTDYDKFLLYYSSLELYNVTKEKSSGKTKSFNFRSLQNDAKHAWYASFSDYLISDDRGLLMKAYISYRYFKIPTKILCMSEFINMKNQFLNQEEDGKSFSETLKFEAKNGLVLKGETFNDTSRIIKPSHIFFNYFNRIKENKNVVTLFCERTPKTNNVMYREVEIIVNKLIDFFGIDDHNKGYYDFEREIKEDEKYFRIWTLDNLKVRLWNACVTTGTTMCLDLKLE